MNRKTVTHEIICIKRTGFEFVATEGADFAAKVTYLAHEPGKIYDPRVGVQQELLIPIPGRWPQ